MANTPLSRRAFLRSTAASATAAGLLPAGLAVAAPAPAVTQHAWPENGTLIPDEGWHLWVDEHATWKDDALFLPEDINLTTLPTNVPTGGWGILQSARQTPVTLPSTVEQRLWGAFGKRSYTPEEYGYAADDPTPQNGAYAGVSWWHRAIIIPAAMRGKRIFLHIRGAHLRAEVYLNQKLVGYSIMEELPFECDLTQAARFPGDPEGGENHLAIRITNPFGRYDWIDGLNAQWASVKLFRSNGFGGLDRGMTISANSGLRISDLYVLNTLERHKIEVHFETRSTSARFSADATVAVIDPASAQVLLSQTLFFAAATGPICYDSIPMDSRITPPGRCVTASTSSSWETVTLSVPKARPWTLGDPKLYELRVTTRDLKGNTDTRSTLFGFRTFAPTGFGADAIFRLNGRRIKLYSSISSGFWGYNGMWPTPELAVKEVKQAKRLNLNCLSSHRNLAKEDVLRAHDTLGLLRYMKLGTGKVAIGKLPAGVSANSANIVSEKPTTAADKFAQRYMFVKCVEMVKAFRSHTSVIIYALQNEIGVDRNNPNTTAILAAMRAEDPSRCIVLNDGFVAPPRKAAQAWYEPWNDKLYRSDTEARGGWWNQHQGAGDPWYDEFYKSPTDFTYKSPVRAQLSDFGEMEGCAAPDNHSLMLHQQARSAYPNKSYDHTDHAEILAATDKFLDRWNFRHAFPATESLWLSIGKKCYDTWQNYLENARISDDADFAVISGWESTPIENHSGIVDNLRNFKSDPTPIAATLLPVRPVAKQRSLCTALGESATFDLFLLNDTGHPAVGALTFSVVTPSGKLLKLSEHPAPDQTPKVFSYLVQESYTTPPLTEEGLYRFKYAMRSAPASAQTKAIWVTRTQLLAGQRARRVGVSGITPALRKQLARLAIVEDFQKGQHYDLIVTAGLTAIPSATQSSGDSTGLEAQSSHRKSEPNETPAVTQVGHIDASILDAVRAGTPLLAIPQTDTLSEGVAKQLAAAGAFQYAGAVGDFCGPWMGNWYFVRQHALFAGMPINQAMGIHYAAKARQSNGLLVDGPKLEIIVGYSRDHDRNIGAGTFTTRLGSTKVLYHRVPEMHPILQQRFLTNAIDWLTT